MSEPKKSQWVTDAFGSQVIQGRDCEIMLTRRPGYCDRGNFLAHLISRIPFNDNPVDEQDGWPRYYFDEGRAKLECEAWLIKRKRLLE